MVVRRLNHKSSFLKDKTVLQSAKEFGSRVRPPKIPDTLMLIFSIFLGIFVTFDSSTIFFTPKVYQKNEYLNF